jgi:hypothetical protein
VEGEEGAVHEVEAEEGAVHEVEAEQCMRWIRPQYNILKVSDQSQECQIKMARCLTRVTNTIWLTPSLAHGRTFSSFDRQESK